MKLSYSIFPSPVGWLAIVRRHGKIFALFQSSKDSGEVEKRLLSRYPGAQKRGLSARIQFFLKNFFEGKKTPKLRLDLSGESPFRKRVLQRVQRIPTGEVRSYEWLAKETGSPGGARACGQALHDNPLPILIPCHRVILKSGKKGGFIWGNGVKERLLRLETQSKK